jgi:prophage regulatory protein
MERRILRLPEVSKTVGLKRSAIYERVGAGLFPKPIPLLGRAVGWLSTDVENWISAQVEASREAAWH